MSSNHGHSSSLHEKKIIVWFILLLKMTHYCITRSSFFYFPSCVSCHLSFIANQLDSREHEAGSGESEMSETAQKAIKQVPPTLDACFGSISLQTHTFALVQGTCRSPFLLETWISPCWGVYTRIKVFFSWLHSFLFYLLVICWITGPVLCYIPTRRRRSKSWVPG